MPTKQLLTENSREYINEGNLSMAALRTAADLEWFLFGKLFFEKRVPPEIIENSTLGKYIQWNIKLGLIDEGDRKVLNDFNELRNQLIHKRVLFENLMANKERRKIVECVTIEVCDFLDRTEIKSSIKMEKRYTKYSPKEREAEMRLFDRLKPYTAKHP